MPREVDLIKYLPPFYYDGREETEALMNAENPEFDLICERLTQLRDDQFAATCGETRLRQWEHLLEIRPDYAAQSLEERREVVIMLLSTRLPLTYRWLVQKSEQTLGAGNFEVEVIHNEYKLKMRVYSEMKIIDEYLRYLRRVIPANLGLYYDRVFTRKQYVGQLYFQRDKVTVDYGAFKGENTHNIGIWRGVKCYERFIINNNSNVQ